MLQLDGRPSPILCDPWGQWWLWCGYCGGYQHCLPPHRYANAMWEYADTKCRACGAFFIDYRVLPTSNPDSNSDSNMGEKANAVPTDQD